MATTSSSLARYLAGDHWELKEKIKSYIEGDELFRLSYDVSIPELRDVTNQRVKYLMQLFEIREHFGSQDENKKNFTNKTFAFTEIFCTTDLSVAVKMGVNVTLFGGAIRNLGNKEQVRKWYKPLNDFEFTGMFCMSERGHGSNVRGITTEAHYDASTQEFIIHTPDVNACKIYIGNALNGEYAAVFAQLYIGGIKKGPHCFIVPIRDGSGLKRGVAVVDMGMKEGLNGVDNGMLSFHQVRIPRKNLLNKFADVTAEGQYITSIASNGARFNAMLGALLGTRLALCLQALTAMKVGLEIAVKYGLRRRQFGPSGGQEQLLMDYQTHQLRLMPYLASSLALTFTSRYAGDLLDEDVFNKKDIVDNRELQALAAGLKAYCTWECVAALQACRECTGGMGYMEVNRLSSLKRDTDVFVTFEGDNMVILQQVAKELLAGLSKQYKERWLVAMLSTLTDNVGVFFKTSFLALNFSPVTSVDFVKKALKFKEGLQLRTLAARLLSKINSEGVDSFGAWNQCLDHSLSLGRCHVQRVTLEKFEEAVRKCPMEEDRAILDKYLRLYAVHLLYEDRAWYLECGYMSPSMSKIIRDEYINLCREARKHALDIVEAFGHPKICVGAPIAGIPNDDAPWAYYPDSDMPGTKSRL